MKNKYLYVLAIVSILLANYSCDSNHEIKDNTTEQHSLEVALENNMKTTIYGDRSVHFNHSAGIYWYGYFVADFGNVSGLSDAEKNRNVITDSQTLSVQLLKDEIGQAGGTICDIEINKGTEYILSYKVKFQSDFEWTKGGKLPGLGGGEVYAGGQDVSVGDGWSFRPVWHYYAGINDDKPFIAPYAYYVDQPGIYGNEFGKRYTIKDNKWYKIWIHIKMNTNQNSDGKLHMKINNSTVYYNSSFRWVTDDHGREIDELMWDIFRGGVGSDYMASEDNLIYFDDFVIDQR